VENSAAGEHGGTDRAAFVLGGGASDKVFPAAAMAAGGGGNWGRASLSAGTTKGRGSTGKRARRG
jgi:hypothetical protein